MSDPWTTAEALLVTTERCVLATHGAAGLTGGTMFYAIAGRWRLALVSHADSRHIANMLETQECIVVVARASQFGEPALQIRAYCRPFVADENSPDSRIARALYDRFPGARAEFAGFGRRSVTVAVDVVFLDLLDEQEYGVGGNVRLDILPSMTEMSEQGGP